jgi:hypothetical protein
MLITSAIPKDRYNICMEKFSDKDDNVDQQYRNNSELLGIGGTIAASYLGVPGSQLGSHTQTRYAD